MPRRRPAQLRADAVYRRPLDGSTSVISGLSPLGLRAIAHLERTRLWNQAVADALKTWSWFVRHPWRRLWDPTAGCGFMQCCPNPPEVRWILDVAAAALPRKDARRLRKQVADLDELW
jgi:hypothetical protein